MHRIQQVAVAALFSAFLAAPAVAQQQNYSAVSQADIQRLQDNVYQAAMDIQQLRGRDAARATQLQSQLDDLREEVIYLKVKLRKDGTLGRSEYSSVRDRIEDVRSQSRETNNTSSTATGATSSRSAATGSTTSTASSSTGRSTTSTTTTAARAGDVEIPAGTELDVRLTNVLNSGTAQVEDRFGGPSLVDVNIPGRTDIRAGAAGVARGQHV